MLMRILVIGGMAAGATAAQFARKTDRKAEVTIVGREPQPIYSKCGLPYSLSGRIPTFEQLVEFDERWFERFKIRLKLGTEATSVDSSARTVTTRDLRHGSEETLKYDSLILATGARPWMPPMEGAYTEPGVLKEGVHLIRTMGDGKRLSENAWRDARAVIIGGGLIGMEFAEALTVRGVHVTIVELLPEILLASLDEDMAAAARQIIEKTRTPVYLKHSAKKITGAKRAESVIIEHVDTKESKEILADIVVISTGTRANTELAVKAGCELGLTGQIKVNSRCATSVPGIFAAGDCTEYVDLITGKPVAVGMGTVAARQGRTAGINAAGGNSELPPGLLGTRVTMAFGMHLAGVGPTEAQLRKAGIEPVIGRFAGSTLPDYIPGGRDIIVKVLAHPSDGRILGAQIVGTGRVHQRINAFAVAILAGMTIDQFSKLETAYAPPIAPTLDAITLACDVALMRMKKGR
jgi:NADH oxidase (H2O2-forming)